MRGVLPADVIRLTPNVWTAPYWEAAGRHELIIPRCRACGRFRFPPTPFCWNCRAQEVEWVQHGGDGVVYSFTVVRHAVIPEVRDALPVIAAVIELPGTGGCRLVSNIVDCEPADVRIGMPVSLDWYDIGEGTSIPVFRLRMSG